MNKKITLRPWQTKAVKTIAQALCVPHSLVAVNASVGSGKTFVPFEAIVNFIKQHIAFIHTSFLLSQRESSAQGKVCRR